MISFIRGTVIDIGTQSLIVLVADIGYKIFVTHTEPYAHGMTVELSTHLAVRENALDLYGFETHDGLKMFELLLKLPKVGPKTALQLLTQASPTLLSEAVERRDPTYLATTSGMTKKTAEKIVAGLEPYIEAGDFVTHTPKPSHHTDVLDALIVLGYTRKDALAALDQIPETLTDTGECIKFALTIIRQ